MADNKKTNKTTTKQQVRRAEKVDLLRICAFWGIFLAAALFVANGILHLLNVNSAIVSVLDIIAKLALLVAVGIPAWDYVKGKGKPMRVLFFVALIIYIAGCVMGVI